MANIENLMKRKLYRALCPPPEILGEYHLGSVSAIQAHEVEHHLKECPHCRSELDILKRYLSDVAPDINYNLGEQLKIWIARLIPPAGPQLAPQFGLRGDDLSGLMRFAIGEGGAAGEMSLEIQDDPAMPGRRALLGLLTGLPDGMAMGPLLAVLWQKGKPVAEGAVDEFGNLSISGLEPGTYDLLLSGDSFEIHLQNLKV